MSDDLVNKIAQTLLEREIKFDRATLTSALCDSDSQTAIREWVEEYLSPETLLSKNEADLYEILTQTGDAETLSKHDLSLVPALHDHELQTAIEELRRSTTAIEKQNETLRLQQTALSALVKNEKRSQQARSQAERGRVRKWEAEKSSVAAAISESTQSLIYQTSDVELQLKTSDNYAKQIVDSILQFDDKLLLSFQKLVSDLDMRQPENESMVQRIKELCARNIKYTVEGVRTRLDRVFLGALNHHPDGSNPQADQQEAAQLQEELESLYTEILPVAQMSAEQQYLDPALRALGATNSHVQERSTKAVGYISDCLDFLTNRIQIFLEKVQEHRCHRMATEAILKMAKEELSHHEPTCLSTPLPRHQARKARYSSSYADQEVEPEQQLAQTWGINLPESEVSEEANVAAMEKILAEKSARLEAHAADLESTIESCVSSHLLEAQVTLNLLRDVLLTNSAYHTVKLADPNLVDAEELLEQEIHQVQAKLEAVDLSELQKGNPHRDKFDNQWSR